MSDESFLKKVFSKIKIEYIIVIIFAVIIIVIVANGTTNKESTNTLDVDNYVTTLEGKLKNSLSMVNGAGKVDVIISVESGMETVLASTKTTENGLVTETPFTVGGKTVVLTETYPKISGVIIVAEGGNNLSVKVALINATSVFLNIEEDKIKILTMKK